MKIQVNTDDHIDGREALATRIEAAMANSLDRFSAHITRLEIHLSDENGDKNGQADKRCVLEARLEGRRPIAVTCEAATIDLAVAGATDKLKGALGSTLDQLYEHRSSLKHAW